MKKSLLFCKSSMGLSRLTPGPFALDMIPHSQWRYSGGGYTLMQQILIDVAGKSFPNILEEVVLRVIGMKNSTYQQPLPQALAASAATAHRKGRKLSGKWHIYPEMAAAGLWTTPSDLALFAIELQNTISGLSNKVLSTSMANLMVTDKCRTMDWDWLSGRRQVRSFQSRWYK